MAEGATVVACLCPADLRPEVDPLRGSVTRDPRRAALSAADQAALEHALRAGEAWHLPVLAVAAGPGSIDPVLVEVRALGASVLRVHMEHENPADQAAVAAALAAALAGSGRPLMVFCGDRSPLSGTGAVPAFLAARLGCPSALGLVGVEVQGALTVSATRRLDRGWREEVVVEGPAVLSVEGAGTRLRRAAFAPLLASGRAPVPVFIPPASAGPALHFDPPRPYRPRPHMVPAPAGDARHRLLQLTGALTAREPPRVLGPLGPAEAADELLSYLGRLGDLAAP